MLSVVLALNLLLASASYQDPDRLVDDMIARSNALKSFVATYKTYSRSNEAKNEDSEVSIHLVYRAPDDLRVEFESGSSRSVTIISGGRISALVEKDDRPVQHGDADFQTTLVQERARIRRTFHEKFPALDELDEMTSLGPYVSFTWKAGTESDRPKCTLQVGTGRGDDPLLDWLSRLKRSSAQLTTEGEDVVWEPAEGCRILILKDSGFIQKFVATYGEKQMVFELADLALDKELGDEEFRVQKIEVSVADTSESLGATLGFRMLSFMQTSIRRRTCEAVEAGKLDWDADTREGLGEVYRAFHSEFAPFYWADSIRTIRASVDKYCLWYQKTKQGIPEDDVDHAGAALEEKRIDWEKSFRENMEKVIEQHCSRGVPEIGSANASKVSGEVRAIELEAASAACRKSVVEPLLEYFTMQIELAGRGELPPANH